MSDLLNILNVQQLPKYPIRVVLLNCYKYVLGDLKMLTLYEEHKI